MFLRLRYVEENPPEKPAVFAGLEASGISPHHSPHSSSLLGSAMKLSFCTYVLVPALHLFCIIIRKTHLCSATQNVVVQSSGNPMAASGFHGSGTKHLGPSGTRLSIPVNLFSGFGSHRISNLRFLLLSELGSPCCKQSCRSSHEA